MTILPSGAVRLDGLDATAPSDTTLTDPTLDGDGRVLATEDLSELCSEPGFELESEPPITSRGGTK